jgi:hypothetical protein
MILKPIFNRLSLFYRKGLLRVEKAVTPVSECPGTSNLDGG